MRLPDDVYARLLTLRTGLRHFERWSEQQAKAAGLTPAQHQLLLAIRGHGDARGPTIGEVADYLLLRHHSTVELVDRADAAGLVVRARDADDHRVVRLHLTEAAAQRLEGLSALHLDEVDRLVQQLPGASGQVSPARHAEGFPAPPDSRAGAAAAAPEVALARVYGESARGGAERVLVDRRWPRGVARDNAPFDRWLKDVAPSPALRQWYAHDPARFATFAQRYRSELRRSPASDAVAELARLGRDRGVVLMTASQDLARSSAAVLRDVLSGG